MLTFQPQGTGNFLGASSLLTARGVVTAEARVLGVVPGKGRVGGFRMDPLLREAVLLALAIVDGTAPPPGWHHGQRQSMPWRSGEWSMSVPPAQGGASRERRGVTLNHPTTSHANSAGVICPPKHFGCAGEYDQGLFSVSRKTVQFADTFDSSMYIHVNGPRHIPAKANTPSSNCHRQPHRQDR